MQGCGAPSDVMLVTLFEDVQGVGLVEGAFIYMGMDPAVHGHGSSHSEHF